MSLFAARGLNAIGTLVRRIVFGAVAAGAELTGVGGSPAASSIEVPVKVLDITAPRYLEDAVYHCPSLRAWDMDSATSDGGLGMVVVA